MGGVRKDLAPYRKPEISYSKKVSVLKTPMATYNGCKVLNCPPVLPPLPHIRHTAPEPFSNVYPATNSHATMHDHLNMMQQYHGHDPHILRDREGKCSQMDVMTHKGTCTRSEVVIRPGTTESLQNRTSSVYCMRSTCTPVSQQLLQGLQEYQWLLMLMQ